MSRRIGGSTRLGMERPGKGGPWYHPRRLGGIHGAGVIPTQVQDDESRAEGKSCLCDGLTLHRRESIEFLGNPVKATYFCLQCGERTHPCGGSGNGSGPAH